MRIKVEEDSITDTATCQHRKIRVVPCEEEPGHVMLSEEDFFTLMGANHAVGQKVRDLEKCVQNWIERARDNDQATRVWRNVCLILGGSMAAIEGVRLSAWLR